MSSEYYREKIIETVKEIKNEKLLKLIFGFVRSVYNEEKEGV